VVRNGEHRLPGETKPFQFHRRRDHRERLARADNVGEQRVGRLQDAPHARFLVSMQLNRPARAGQRQVVAVESADTRVVERVVVEAAEAFAVRVIRPHPLLEPLFDAFLLFASGFGRLRVHDRLLVHDVVHRRRLEVQRILDEFECGVAVCSPIRRVCSRALRLPIRVQVPGAKGVDVADFDARRNIEQLVNELLHVVRRQPGSAEPHVNLRRG